MSDRDPHAVELRADHRQITFDPREMRSARVELPPTRQSFAYDTSVVHAAGTELARTRLETVKRRSQGSGVSAVERFPGLSALARRVLHKELDHPAKQFVAAEFSQAIDCGGVYQLLHPEL